MFSGLGSKPHSGHSGFQKTCGMARNWRWEVHPGTPLLIRVWPVFPLGFHHFVGWSPTPDRTTRSPAGRIQTFQGLPSLRRHKANAATAGGDRETPSEENTWSLWKPPVGSTADISSLSPLRFNCCRSSFCPILLVVFETAQGSNLQINISQCPPPKPSKPSKNARMPDYAIRPIIKHLCHCGLQPHILRCGACLHCHVDSKTNQGKGICAYVHIHTLHYIALHYIILYYITYIQTHTHAHTHIHTYKERKKDR